MFRKSNTTLKYHSSTTECSGISLGWGGTRNFIKLKKCIQLRKKIATKIKTTTVFFFFAIPKILQINYRKVKLNEVLKVSTTLSPSHCFLTIGSGLTQRTRHEANMAAGQTSGSKNLNDFESVLELVHRQANKFFTGM